MNPFKLLFAFLVLLPLIGTAQLCQEPVGYCEYYKAWHFQTDTLDNDWIADTTATPLWQLGNSGKPAFTGRAMMTDTAHAYPVNANNALVLKIPHSAPNVIISFRHSYQTTSLRDGGIVEFSTDTGSTWTNVLDCSGSFPQVCTENFYLYTDTLHTGEKGFSGTASAIYSRLQFFNCIGVKGTTSGCYFHSGDYMMLRFRFISDSTADTLAGWKIDSVQVKGPGCVPGAVKEVTSVQPSVFPNPSSGIFNFDIDGRIPFTVRVYNSLGQMVLESKNKQIDLSGYNDGVYYYKIVTENYCGGGLLHLHH
jgi:hypothetical protein